MIDLMPLSRIKFRPRLASLLIVFLAAMFLQTSCDSGQPSKVNVPLGKKSVTIGTGPITGLYLPSGELIARTVNNDVKIHGIHTKAESTKGSVLNINAIMAGTLEFGIAQSDRVYEAFSGLGQWERKGSQKDLRALFSLHSESVVVVAADEAGIKTIQDLRGKRVDIGEPGLGSRQNAIHALENAGIDYTKDLTAKGYRAAEVAGVLREGGIDAFFYTVGHPNITVLNATTSRRRVHFVPITGVDRLLMKYPYYVKAVVPIKFYPQATNKSEVETFAVKATVVSSAKVPDRVVYTITKEVFEQIESYRTLHPAFEELTREKMLECLAAPVHPGAEKYYDEVGLVPACVVN
jgi:TRAP transporter TAXI family solute receptor